MQEVGVDEWEEDGAEAFDFYYYVAILFDSLHVALLTLEGAAGDAHFHALFEIGLAVDFAAGGVGGCKKPDEVDIARRYFGRFVFALIAIDPEGGYGVEGVAGAAFEVENPLAVGHYEYHARDYGSDLSPAVDGCAHLFGEEDRVDFILQLKFELEFPTGF